MTNYITEVTEKEAKHIEKFDLGKAYNFTMNREELKLSFPGLEGRRNSHELQKLLSSLSR